MDKSAIFSELTKRNALRQAHGLPSLDVRAEYDHAVAAAAEGDFQALCDAHAADREAIREEVLAEYRERFGPAFGYTMGGRWAVGEMARKRFAAFMADRYRMARPMTHVARNSVTYGEAREDASQPPLR